MKIKQLFCSHKEKHLIGYDYLCGFLNCPIYEVSEIYECDKCGKKILIEREKYNERTQKRNELWKERLR